MILFWQLRRFSVFFSRLLRLGMLKPLEHVGKLRFIQYSYHVLAALADRVFSSHRANGMNGQRWLGAFECHCTNMTVTCEIGFGYDFSLNCRLIRWMPTQLCFTHRSQGGSRNRPLTDAQESLRLVENFMTLNRSARKLTVRPWKSPIFRGN